MRLWHYKLIEYLDAKHLLSQHRECCALRGNGWKKPHATVNYVFEHDPGMLVAYHLKVIAEMKARGYKVEPAWLQPNFRGFYCDPWQQEMRDDVEMFPEHDDEYLKFCIDLLEKKGCDVDLMRMKLL